VVVPTTRTGDTRHRAAWARMKTKQFLYPEWGARPSASAGAALPRRCATDARHRAA